MNRTFDIHAAAGCPLRPPPGSGGKNQAGTAVVRFSRACGLFPVNLADLARSAFFPAGFLPALPVRRRHILRSWPIPVRSAAQEDRMDDRGKPPMPEPGPVSASEKLTAKPLRWLSMRERARRWNEQRNQPLLPGAVGPMAARRLHAIEEAPMQIFHKLDYPTTLCSGKARMSPLSKVEMSLSRRGFVVWENGLGLADNERAGSAADRGSGRGGR